MQIVVTGNCQSTALSRLLAALLGSKGLKHEITTWPELHLIQENELPDLTSTLNSADLLLAMPVGDNYRGMPLGTSQLAEQCRPACQVTVYPNLYFKGYHPNYDYIRDIEGNHITARTHSVYGQNPFGDYHDQCAFAFFFSACPSLSAAVSQYNHFLEEIHEELASAHQKVLIETLSEMRRREHSCTFSLSDFIATGYKKERLFHSFNHPANALLLKVAQYAMESVDAGFSPSHEPAYETLPELLLHPQLPILPTVASAIGLTFEIDNQLNNHISYQYYFDFLSANKNLFEASKANLDYP